MNINCDKIFVLDNTPKWLQAFLEQNFRWFRFMTHNHGDPAKPEDGWLFGCMLFDVKNMGWFHDTPASVYALHEYFMKELVFEIDKNVTIRDLVRIRVNGMNSSSYSGPHTDSDKDNIWAALYYVNDSSGTTDIFDLDGSLVKSIEPKAGRFVVFPARFKHKGNAPSNTNDWRITLNFNYVIDGEINRNLILNI